MPNVYYKLVSGCFGRERGAKAYLIHSNLSRLLFVLVIWLLGRHDGGETASLGTTEQGKG